MVSNNKTTDLYAHHQELIGRHFGSKKTVFEFPAPFARGANNLLYRFRQGDLRIVAKVGINPLFRNLHLEKAVLDRIGSVGPRAIDFFIDEEDDTQAIILEDIGGIHPLHLDAGQLVRMGAVIAAYHSTKAVIPGIQYETNESFLENRLCTVLPIDSIRPWHDRYRRLLDKVVTHAALFPEDDSRRVLVHGDLIPLNILYEVSGAVRIIDWEGARYDAPEADIATLYKSYNLDDEGMTQLLSGYAAPFDKKVFDFRLLTHYLQVIAWRLSIRLLQEKSPSFDDAAQTLEVEMDTAEGMLERLI